MNKFPLCILAACLVTTSDAPGAPSIVEKIARSLPASEAEWRLTDVNSYRRDDGSVQASVRWTNGSIEKGATVIVHPTVKAAKRAFQPHGKEDLSGSFRIDGVGDEAFLWPPKTPSGGAYNLRFRKAHVEVWISGSTEEEAKRHARVLAASITTKPAVKARTPVITYCPVCSS